MKSTINENLWRAACKVNQGYPSVNRTKRKKLLNIRNYLQTNEKFRFSGHLSI